MDYTTKIVIPYPPASGNHQHGRSARRTFLRPEIVAYRLAVKLEVAKQVPLKDRPLTGDLIVTIVSHPPDRRRRDLDNLKKPVGDALTHAKLWNDDYQICELTIIRAEPDPENPRVCVEVALGSTITGGKARRGGKRKTTP